MIDITSGISSIGSKLSGAFHSPLWTAIIITLLLFIIIVFAYPAKRNTPAATFIKFLLYTFAIVFSGVFIHSIAVEARFKSQHEDKAKTQMLGGYNGHVESSIPGDIKIRIPTASPSNEMHSMPLNTHTYPPETSANLGTNLQEVLAKLP